MALSRQKAQAQTSGRGAPCEGATGDRRFALGAPAMPVVRGKSGWPLTRGRQLVLSQLNLPNSSQQVVSRPDLSVTISEVAVDSAAPLDMGLVVGVG